ncbi:D-serine dehydratase protein [Rutstroemia sp. NJR-2017a BBW]|nr:D-serine dehydratase protein [Rutstroemia sp. NJR-2017a BBW]
MVFVETLYVGDRHEIITPFELFLRYEIARSLYRDEVSFLPPDPGVYLCLIHKLPIVHSRTYSNGISLFTASTMESSTMYPLVSRDDLVKSYVGKSLHDVSCPAAVLDLSKVKKNCSDMLHAVDSLGFGWRAHIKTHKTTELTRLQVGAGSRPANIVVSTIIEAENIVPLLLEYKSDGRDVNVLYSFPVAPGAVDRLAAISKALGPRGLSLMIDHPAQLDSVSRIYAKSGIPPLIFIKIDMGGHRAGVIPDTTACTDLISSVLSLAKRNECVFHGLYSHAGHSYSSNSQTVALDYLRQELESLLVTVGTVNLTFDNKTHLVLSVGATPTTTSIRNLFVDVTSEEESREVSALKATIGALRELGHEIELHAGVYPVLDLQQLATHALPENILGFSSLGLTILAEVASLYPSRGTSNSSEALITAGSLAITLICPYMYFLSTPEYYYLPVSVDLLTLTLSVGREPCKAYAGWGILTPWNRSSFVLPNSGPENYSGWQISRISQEHGILTNPGKNDSELTIGQKIRIWPNHACIAGAGYGWYLVVDESRKGKEDEIVDIWVRWRGW